MNTDMEKIIVVNNIPEKGLGLSFKFTDDELSIINQERIPENIKVLTFNSDINLKFLTGSDKILRLTGNIKFKIATICGISLEPVELLINENLEVDFCEKIAQSEQKDETHLLPETIENGAIDIYDVLIQELILSIPSNIIKEGADISELEYTPSKIDIEASRETKGNPFEILQKLKVDE